MECDSGPLDNRVNANDIVAVASEKGLAVGRPGERQALRLRRVLAETRELGLDLVHNRLALKVKDWMSVWYAQQIRTLDARGSSSAEPVAVRREDEGVDNVTSLKRVQVLAVRELPEHGNAVLATRGTERAVRRNRDRVDVAGVTVVVGHELAAVQLPDLCVSTVPDIVPQARRGAQ